MIQTNIQVTLVPIYKSELPNKSLKSPTHRNLYSAAAIQMGTGSTGSKQMQTVSTYLSSISKIHYGTGTLSGFITLWLSLKKSFLIYVYRRVYILQFYEKLVLLFLQT